MRRAVWLLSLVLLSLMTVAALSFAQLSNSPGDPAAARGQAGVELAQAGGGGGMGGGGMAGGRGMMGGMGGEHACAMALSLSRSPLVVVNEDMYQVEAGMLVKLDRNLNVAKTVELPGLMPAAGQQAAPHAFGAFFLPSLAADNRDVYVTAGGTVYKYDRNLNLVSQRALPMPTDNRLSAMCPMAMMGAMGGGGGMGGGGMGGMGGGMRRRGARGG